MTNCDSLPPTSAGTTFHDDLADGIACGRIVGDTLFLGQGLALADLRVTPSQCGQYLLLYCGDELVAIYGAMGGSVRWIGFGGGLHAIEDVLDHAICN
jgi:hypothetical protein